MVIDIDISWFNAFSWPRRLVEHSDDMGGLVRGLVLPLPFVWIRARWRA